MEHVSLLRPLLSARISRTESQSHLTTSSTSSLSTEWRSPSGTPFKPLPARSSRQLRARRNSFLSFVHFCRLCYLHPLQAGPTTLATTELCGHACAGLESRATPGTPICVRRNMARLVAVCLAALRFDVTMTWLPLLAFSPGVKKQDLGFGVRGFRVKVHITNPTRRALSVR